MNNRLTVHYEEKPIYDIVFEHSFANLQNELSSINLATRKVCIVSDSNVEKFYLEELVQLFNSIAKDTISFVFNAGEQNKNLDTVSNLYEQLISSHFDRNDILVALGGGVVGDLTGFAAATYLRGIDFIQIPTSLLAQVDSSIGGKTGVDLKLYKNMVGAFHQPRLVYINLNTLNTLPIREFYSGIGEIVKHALIKDINYYNWLKDNVDLIKEKNIDVLKKMVFDSCIIKRSVVERDPKEKGDRALLNLGHTLGHSIEKLMEFTLLHGECVAIGLVGAANISYKRGYITSEELNDIITILKSFNLPISIKDLDPQAIIDVTKLDKKVKSGKLSFILLEEIGKAIINTDVNDSELLNAIEDIMKTI